MQFLTPEIVEALHTPGATAHAANVLVFERIQELEAIDRSHLDFGTVQHLAISLLRQLREALSLVETYELQLKSCDRAQDGRPEVFAEWRAQIKNNLALAQVTLVAASAAAEAAQEEFDAREVFNSEVTV